MTEGMTDKLDELWVLCSLEAPEEGVRYIEFTGKPEEVILHYYNGDTGFVYWRYDLQRWIFPEPLNTSCPCDVAARDVL